MTRLEFTKQVNRSIRGEHDVAAYVVAALAMIAFVGVLLWGVG